jgi:O-antigen/teichoic acid export membrane protein
MGESEKQSSSNRLFKGTVVYFIGTFISKSMTILILPLITIKLTTEQYGYYDLIITITMIIMPIFTLQSIEAVFRFLFDADEKRKRILLSSVWAIVSIGIIVCGAALLFVTRFVYEIPYWQWLYAYYIANTLLTMYQRVARSLGKNLQFAISGIVNTITMLVFQIIALVCFSATIEGLIIAFAISALITCAYLEYHTMSLRQFSFENIELPTIKEIIRFGLPLVPNNISWWAVSTANKLLIISYLGAGANGIYAITAKFTALLTVLINVFRLSWQESAIVAYSENNKEKFYSKVFNTYISLVFCVCFILLPLIKIVLPILVASNYQSAWLYIPITMIGVSISAIVSFYGAGYMASGKTGGAFWTTNLGTIINLVFCLIFIRKIGLFAPAIATTLAYLGMWITRHISMRSFYRITINYKKILLLTLIGIISLYFYYHVSNIGNVMLMLILCLYTLIDNKELINSSAKRILSGMKSFKYISK